jgi:LemA protein
VIAARNAAFSTRDPEQQAQLSGALGRLMALAESYPELKANSNFQMLQQQLDDIEAKLAAARRFFNNAAAEYNAGMQSFPAVLFARNFGFTECDFYQIEVAEKAALDTAPAVKF